MWLFSRLIDGVKVFRRLRFSPLSQENGGEKQGDGKNYSPDSLEPLLKNNLQNSVIFPSYFHF
jgi:hypothetical protein